VAPDDLNAPLGQNKPKPRSGIGAPQILAAILACTGAVVAGWAALVKDPLGGEPVAIVSAKPAPEAAGRPHDGAASEPEAPRPPAVAEKPPLPAGAKTITIIDGSSGSRQEVIVPIKPDKRSSLAPAEQNLLEPTKLGAIPKIGPDGARAAQAYAEPRTSPRP
jgi:hypothetical protein